MFVRISNEIFRDTYSIRVCVWKKFAKIVIFFFSFNLLKSNRGKKNAWPRTIFSHRSRDSRQTTGFLLFFFFFFYFVVPVYDHQTVSRFIILYIIRQISFHPHAVILFCIRGSFRLGIARRFTIESSGTYLNCTRRKPIAYIIRRRKFVSPKTITFAFYILRDGWQHWQRDEFFDNYLGFTW